MVVSARGMVPSKVLSLERWGKALSCWRLWAAAAAAVSALCAPTWNLKPNVAHLTNMPRRNGGHVAKLQSSKLMIHDPSACMITQEELIVGEWTVRGAECWCREVHAAGQRSVWPVMCEAEMKNSLCG